MLNYEPKNRPTCDSTVGIHFIQWKSNFLLVWEMGCCRGKGARKEGRSARRTGFRDSHLLRCSSPLTGCSPILLYIQIGFFLDLQHNLGCRNQYYEVWLNPMYLFILFLCPFFVHPPLAPNSRI